MKIPNEMNKEIYGTLFDGSIQGFPKPNLNHENVQILIEFISCLPGTNVRVERLLSLINMLSTKRKLN